MSKPTIAMALCADDFGLSENVDQGILSLLEAGRLTSTSCMTTSPRWLSDSVPMLVQSQGEFETGVHLNWTEPFPQESALSLKTTLLKNYLHTLDPKTIEQHIHAQLDAFERGMNKAPDFIDGHQHVHQFPQIRSVLLKVLQTRYRDQALWVRNTVPNPLRLNFKELVLATLGGWTLQRQLQRAGIPTNDGFLGVYGFDVPDYDRLFAAWLKRAQHGALMMCHPGIGADAHDVIGSQRVLEYAFFSSPRFLELLEQHRVRLVPLKAILS